MNDEQISYIAEYNRIRAAVLAFKFMRMSIALLEANTETAKEMKNRLKAIARAYEERMNNDDKSMRETGVLTRVSLMTCRAQLDLALEKGAKMKRVVYKEVVRGIESSLLLVGAYGLPPLSESSASEVSNTDEGPGNYSLYIETFLNRLVLRIPLFSRHY